MEIHTHLQRSCPFVSSRVFPHFFLTFSFFCIFVPFIYLTEHALIEESRQYEASQKEYWDYNSTLETYLSKGETKEKLQIAQRMKAMGFDIKIIAEATQLSIEEIEKL